MRNLKRRSHTEWCELIAEQESEELTIEAFCRKHDVSAHSFHYHKHKRNRTGTQEVGFEELRLVSTGSIRLKPTNWKGHIEVQQGFDPTCLRALLDVLA